MRPANERRADGDWEDVLSTMATHVEVIRASLEGRGPVVAVPQVELPAGPLPASLASRARMLLAEQNDVEIALRERLGILGAAVGFEPQRSRAAPSLYIDRTA